MMREMESVGDGVASYLQLFLLHLELISVILPPVTARELVRGLTVFSKREILRLDGRSQRARRERREE